MIPGGVLLLLVLAAGSCSNPQPRETATGTATTAVTSGGPASPAGTGQDNVFSRIPDIVRRVEPSVVTILNGRGVGSGVIWSADGLIGTNDHVVAGARALEVAFADGRRLPAQVRASDPLTDLAVLQVGRGGLPAATFAAGLPEVGELAVAMGSPLGLEKTVTAGIVSGAQRSIPGADAPSLVGLLQTDAAISPGNSGGALVDADGQVIGINEAYLPPATGAVAIGFAIPAPTVTHVVRQLLDTGRARHAFLGVEPASLTPDIARRLGIDRDRGIVVLDVTPGGPAAAAGIRPGDVIIALDGNGLDTVEDLLARLRQKSPGDRLSVRILRDGAETSVEVILGERQG